MQKNVGNARDNKNAMKEKLNPSSIEMADDNKMFE